jgi:hypothetical protein
LSAGQFIFLQIMKNETLCRTWIPAAEEGWYSQTSQTLAKLCPAFLN